LSGKSEELREDTVLQLQCLLGWGTAGTRSISDISKSAGAHYTFAIMVFSLGAFGTTRNRATDEIALVWRRWPLPLDKEAVIDTIDGGNKL
jgi:hypothetical protein